MSLKFKYIVFIIVLHSVLITLVYFLLREDLWYFLGAEVLVFISLYFSYLLYRSFIRPIDLLHSGIDAIADKDFSVKYLATGSTEVDHLVDVYNKMIDTLRDERTMISEQSHFIQKLIDVTPIGIIIMDYDGLISDINLSAKQHLGIASKEDATGKKISDYPSDITEILKQAEIGSPEIITINAMDKYKVQVNEVIHQGFKRKFILIDDLSNELLKTEKEAYGTIIRMMAHEVNNSMGAINSILDTVVEFGFEGQGDQELKESLLVARKRNVGLSQFMDNFASLLRLPTPIKKKIDLARLLKKTGQLFVHNALEKNIKIHFEVPKHEVTITADAVLLEQAISNIIKNAIEAIGQDGEVRITCSEDPVRFIIADNGPGISAEVAKHLFTPFYSTKTTGQGVGLMLVRDILSSHQAEFSLSTSHDSGWTNFEVIIN